MGLLFPQEEGEGGEGIILPEVESSKKRPNTLKRYRIII
jgi:hypothetical protein